LTEALSLLRMLYLETTNSVGASVRVAALKSIVGLSAPQILPQLKEHAWRAEQLDAEIVSDSRSSERQKSYQAQCQCAYEVLEDVFRTVPIAEADAQPGAPRHDRETAGLRTAFGHPGRGNTAAVGLPESSVLQHAP
jgi:hypothetical protein